MLEEVLLLRVGHLSKDFSEEGVDLLLDLHVVRPLLTVLLLGLGYILVYDLVLYQRVGFLFFKRGFFL